MGSITEARMLVHIIADYGYGDLALVEVVQRLLLCTGEQWVGLPAGRETRWTEPF